MKRAGKANKSHQYAVQDPAVRKRERTRLREEKAFVEEAIRLLYHEGRYVGAVPWAKLDQDPFLSQNTGPRRRLVRRLLRIALNPELIVMPPDLLSGVGAVVRGDDKLAAHFLSYVVDFYRKRLKLLRGDDALGDLHK